MFHGGPYLPPHDPPSRTLGPHPPVQVVQDTEPHDDFQHHLQVLIKNITAAVYTNICGGLFKKDKTIFSFMIAIQVYQAALLF